MGITKEKKRTVVIGKAEESGAEFNYPAICGKKVRQKQVPLTCSIEIFQKVERKVTDVAGNQKSLWHARKKGGRNNRSWTANQIKGLVDSYK